MDTFPLASDDGRMRSRRELLANAAKLGGLALAHPLIAAAAPYVRLDDERDNLSAEIHRIDREVDDLYCLLEKRPIEMTRTLIIASWANLHPYTGLNVAGLLRLRSRVALLGGINAVSVGDQSGGAHWFDLAQAYSRLAEDRGLNSLVYARRAIAGLYWGEPFGLTLTYSSAALRGAEQSGNGAYKGIAHMARARALASDGRADGALRHIDSALLYASDGATYPRPDELTLPYGHLMASTALANDPKLINEAETYSHLALASVPVDARHFRTHAHLNLAKVRAKDGQYDAAAQVLMGVLGSDVQPVHEDRIRSIVRYVEAKDRRCSAMRPVGERLAALGSR